MDGRLLDAVASVWASPVRWLVLAMISGVAAALAPGWIWAMGWDGSAVLLLMVLWLVVTPMCILAFIGQCVEALLQRRR